MYYNKEKVDEMLNEGIYDPADVVEDLFEFINEIFRCKTIADMKHLKESWEEDK